MDRVCAKILRSANVFSPGEHTLCVDYHHNSGGIIKLRVCKEEQTNSIKRKLRSKKQPSLVSHEIDIQSLSANLQSSLDRLCSHVISVSAMHSGNDTSGACTMQFNCHIRPHANADGINPTPSTEKTEQTAQNPDSYVNLRHVSQSGKTIKNQRNRTRKDIPSAKGKSKENRDFKFKEFRVTLLFETSKKNFNMQTDRGFLKINIHDGHGKYTDKPQCFSQCVFSFIQARLQGLIPVPIESWGTLAVVCKYAFHRPHDRDMEVVVKKIHDFFTANVIGKQYQLHDHYNVCYEPELGNYIEVFFDKPGVVFTNIKINTQSANLHIIYSHSESSKANDILSYTNFMNDFLFHVLDFQILLV